MYIIYWCHVSNLKFKQKLITKPVRLPSTPVQIDRPRSRHRSGTRSSPPTPKHRQKLQEQLHSRVSRIQIISQVVESVALVRDSDEDVYYRNDSMKSVGHIGG